MYFSDALKIVARRWLVVLAGLAVIAAACVTAFLVVPTNHQASGQVLLLPPSTPLRVGQPANPYLNLPDGLTLTATLVSTSQLTLDTQRSLADAGFTSSYSVGVVPGTGPLIVISVEDVNPDRALDTRKAVIERIQAELIRIQEIEAVPDVQLISARLFNVSGEAEVLAGNRLRAIGGIVALGTLTTAFAVFGIDRWSAKRQQRRNDREKALGMSAAYSQGRARDDDTDPLLHEDDWNVQPSEHAGDFAVSATGAHAPSGGKVFTESPAVEKPGERAARQDDMVMP